MKRGPLPEWHRSRAVGVGPAHRGSFSTSLRAAFKPRPREASVDRGFPLSEGRYIDPFPCLPLFPGPENELAITLFGSTWNP